MKTLKYILPTARFKILGAGRTDAKVSALDAAFELFLEDTPLTSTEHFFRQLNENLPPDIRVLDVRQTTQDFNIIQGSKTKEYVYLFSFGKKNHPFCAPFLANILDDLNVDLMKKTAGLFEGEHDFTAYTSRIQKNTRSYREIESCEIRENRVLSANFFPEKSYALHITSKGFMRYQVRMIMGALIQVGRGVLTMADIKASLLRGSSVQLTYVAPASGLLLNKLEFE